MQWQDEILRAVPGDTQVVPRFDLVDQSGVIVAQKVKMELVNEIEQNPTPLNAENLNSIETRVDYASSTADSGVRKADAAQATADRGVQGASNAQGTANSAVEKADNAQGSANAAQGTADEALRRADAAQNTANTGVTGAANAQLAANAAQGTASTALSKANAAQETGNNATAKADAAQSRADAAYAFGENALPKAGGAISGSLAVAGELTQGGSAVLTTAKQGYALAVTNGASYTGARTSNIPFASLQQVHPSDFAEVSGGNIIMKRTGTFLIAMNVCVSRFDSYLPTEVSFSLIKKTEYGDYAIAIIPAGIANDPCMYSGTIIESFSAGQSIGLTGFSSQNNYRVYDISRIVIVQID